MPFGEEKQRRTSRNQFRRAFRRGKAAPNVTQSVQACRSREEKQRRTSRNRREDTKIDQNRNSNAVERSRGFFLPP
ncbi:MAG: hypothetical protein U5K84_14165 [Alkalibacterium sp.]|nr:hypothetical protein [Alkalibacterium sp.]